VSTVADLLGLAEWQGRQVIVEHNGEVIERSNWGVTRLGEQDVLELVYFVGGG
jgi:thiamine biosynthesis protein ThiS